MVRITVVTPRKEKTLWKYVLRAFLAFAGPVSFQGHYDLQLSEDAVPEDIRRGLVAP